MTTLFDLTYQTARLVGGGIMSEGVATGGGTASLIDTNGRKEADNYWVGQGNNTSTVWITYDAGGAGAAPQGQYATVTGFTNSSNTLTFATGAFTVAVASGDRYAIIKKRYPLNVLIQMVNNAIKGLGVMPITDITSVTTASNKSEYTLPIAANLDLRQVFIQNNADSDDNQWSELEAWDVQRSATGSADLLVFPYQPGSNYSIKLVYLSPHPDLLIYSDKLSEHIHPNRVIYDAAYQAVSWYMNKTRSNDFQTQQQQLYAMKQEMDRNYPIHYPRRKSKLVVVNDRYQNQYYPGDRTPR